MQSKNMPSQLPFLPGNVYADPTITRYHKTQLLGVTNGVMTGKKRFFFFNSLQRTIESVARLHFEHFD
jgi:hypothetical protein